MRNNKQNISYIDNELMNYIIKHFAKVTYKDEQTIDKCVLGGFKAAVANQGVKIYNDDKTLITKVDKLIKKITEKIKIFFKESPPKNQNEFDKKHVDLRNYANRQFELLDKEKFKNKKGCGQKIINVTFKNIYSVDKAKREHLKYGHMIIDRFILYWLMNEDKKHCIKLKEKTKQYIKEEIDYAWTKMEDDLYVTLQEEIRNILKNKAKYKLVYPNKTIILPVSPIEAEFIIWYEEKIKRKFGIK